MNTLPLGHPLSAGVTAESLLLRAMRGEPVPRPPVWFMRQAGRSLPEYRKAREGTAMLDACFTPELAAEITMQPVRRHGVDAAILFSDIVVPLKAVGVGVEIQPGVGPVVAEPFRAAADLARLPDLTEEMVRPVLDAVALTTAELGTTPLIGFSGAPFTVGSYLIEGGPSRDLPRTKAMMYGDPGLFHAIMARLADIAGRFLRLQVLAGASAVQVFDSWVGALAPRWYREAVLPHTAAVLLHVADLPVPKVHFAVSASHLLPDMAASGCDVLGIDFRTDLADVPAPIRTRLPLQGNLDPAVLLTDRRTIETEVGRVLDSAEGLVGHVFNLGHGVLPATEPDAITFTVEAVRRLSEARGRRS